MGEYTEINFGAVLRADIPDDVILALSDLSKGVPVREKPDHPFFETPRHGEIMTCHSYMFLRNEAVKPIFCYNPGHQSCWTLIFRSSLKNYDNEIEKFLDWISPYIETGSGIRGYYAVVCEEWDTPEIYYLEELHDNV